MSHEVHLVAVEHLPPDDAARVLDAGFSAVEVSGRHPCLAGAELYSAYVATASAARATFDRAVQVCKSIDDVGLLVERERVVRDIPLAACAITAHDPADLHRALARLCGHGRRYGRNKRADIHLSIPTDHIRPETRRRLADFDVTYLRVARRGDEVIFGRRPSPGEDWTAYTVQIDGRAAHEWALELFELVPALLGADARPPVGTLKVEFAAEMFLTPRHPGIPAVASG